MLLGFPGSSSLSQIEDLVSQHMCPGPLTLIISLLPVLRCSPSLWYRSYALDVLIRDGFDQIWVSLMVYSRRFLSEILDAEAGES